MTVETLIEQIVTITTEIGERPLDDALESHLNERFGPSTANYARLFDTCRAGVAEGWLCGQEAGGIKFGRAAKPSPALNGFSIDVVEMEDVVGPYHAHPNGEIDLVMPLDEAAVFDGRSAGWMVYGPGTEHAPTVAGGRALVLYLLPNGAIEFKK